MPRKKKEENAPLIENGVIETGAKEEKKAVVAEKKERPRIVCRPGEKYDFDPWLVSYNNGQTQVLPTNGQMQWFNAVYPNGVIESSLHMVDQNFVVAKVCIYKDSKDERPAATSYASRSPITEDIIKCHHVDEAVRGATSSALKMLGFSLPTLQPEDALSAQNAKPLPSIEEMIGRHETVSPVQKENEPVIQSSYEEDMWNNVFSPTPTKEDVMTFDEDTEEIIFNPEPEANDCMPVEEIPSQCTEDIVERSHTPLVEVSAKEEPSIVSGPESGIRAMTLEESMDYVITFGKFANYTIKEMLNTDLAKGINNLEWIVNVYGAGGSSTNTAIKIAARNVLEYLQKNGHQVNIR